MCWPNLREDFRRVYEHTSYRGRVRRTLHALTSPGFQAVWSYRAGRWLMQARIPVLGAILQRITEAWTGISIPPEATIGPGLLIHHAGGIVIHGKATIGRDATLHHGVTVGNRVSGAGAPRIGDRVMLGVGCVVIGAIELGHDVEVGANAVALQSLPDGAVAVGIPARIVRIKGAGGTSQRTHDAQ